jgi:hypothetical protein
MKEDQQKLFLLETNIKTLKERVEVFKSNQSSDKHEVIKF